MMSVNRNNLDLERTPSLLSSVSTASSGVSNGIPSTPKMYQSTMPLSITPKKGDFNQSDAFHSPSKSADSRFLSSMIMSSPRSKSHHARSNSSISATSSVGQEVAGLPGRTRLAYADHSILSPSAVFSSSHNTPTKKPSASPLLPSHTVRAIDNQRKNLVAYEYMCHLVETQEWLRSHITTGSPSTPLFAEDVSDFAESLRNGYALAHLARSLGGPNCQRPIFNDQRLQFKHTVNINLFFVFVQEVGLPEIFRFETLDLYEAKNLPKVIYCVHALSHLLARSGKAGEMGDLVGTLSFSEEDVDETQRGLAASGVAMPNFRGLSGALNKQLGVSAPPESAAQRHERELAAAVPYIRGCQAQVRGVLARRAYVTAYRQHVAAERRRAEEAAKLEQERQLLEIERQREEIRAERLRLQHEEALRREAEQARRAEQIRLEAERARFEAEQARLQEQLRMEAEQRRLAEQIRIEKEQIRREKERILWEEEQIRLEEERAAAEERAAVQEAAAVLVGLQAAIRGALLRQSFFERLDALDTCEDAIISFQAACRGAEARNRLAETLFALRECEPAVIAFQAQCRRSLLQGRLISHIGTLHASEAWLPRFQAVARGSLARAAYAARTRTLCRTDVVASVGGLQARARALLVRRSVQVKRQQLGFVQPEVVGLQAQIRGWLRRTDFQDWREYVRSNEDVLILLQALLRGAAARRVFRSKQRGLRAALPGVVGLQSVIRARRQARRYAQLMGGEAVSVDALRTFVWVLDDSEHDYREEQRVAHIRRALARAIRDTQTLETDVADLDTKIELLVKNKISHEDARASLRRAKHTAEGAAVVTTVAKRGAVVGGDATFSAAAPDRATQHRRALYQELFWHLQTSPGYLARLLARTPLRPAAPSGDAFSAQSHLASFGASLDASLDVARPTPLALIALTLTLFGHAQNAREEFLLLKLLQRAIHEEVLHAPDVGTFSQTQYAYVGLLGAYAHSGASRAYLQHALGPSVCDIAGREQLSLVSDPVQLFISLRGGPPRCEGHAEGRVTHEALAAAALSDVDVAATYDAHLIALRRATDLFLQALYGSTRRMPFGIRYVMRELFRALRAAFDHEAEISIVRAVGRILFERVLRPVVLSPERFDLVDSQLSEGPRGNLTEIARLMGQISRAEGAGFDELGQRRERGYSDAGRARPRPASPQTSLTAYLAASASDYTRWVYDVIDVGDAEREFHADAYLDATSASQPVLYISPRDMYATQRVLRDTIDIVAPDERDVVRLLLGELGPPPALTPAQAARAGEEVALALLPRVQAPDEHDADKKALFGRAKHRVLALLKVQSGRDLEEVLTRPVTDDDEDAWQRVLAEERAQGLEAGREAGRRITHTSDDITQMSFLRLKQETLKDIIALRQTGQVSAANKYQVMLDSIAADIRSKHQRRLQRANELETLSTTLASLEDKKKYQMEQIASYQQYIDQSMASIQKKSRNKLVLPWSTQAIHRRQLEKAGKRYKYGSYKYTAQTLYDRRILLSIDRFSPKQYDKISFVLSSDDVGTFEIQVTAGDVQILKEEVKLDELLEHQFEGRQTITLGNGVVKANLSLLVGLINRKFYAS